MSSTDPYHDYYQAKEKDPRWTAVDEYAYSHLLPKETAHTRALAAAIKLQHERGLPDIAVSLSQGAYLAQQCRLLKTKRLLEVGTLGGYSTIWFAGSKADISVTTVEFNPKHSAVARENVGNAGLSDRVEFLEGAGREVLAGLREQVRAGERAAWDFVFIDANKEDNWKHLDLALDMVESGACLIVDNVVRRGKVADAEAAETDKNVRGSREVIEAAGRDGRIDSSTLIQTVNDKNYDGMLICVAK